MGARLTGVAAAEVMGTRDHWRAFYDAPRPCLADLVATRDWGAIDRLYTTHDDPSTPAHGVHAENWCDMPNRGEKRYLVVDAGPVFDDHGNLIAVVETLRDSTDSKLASVKVEEQAERLRAYFDIHERAADLARRILDHQIRTDMTLQSGVAFQVSPADNFSGDMVLAARSPDGRLYALLADAVGHGLASAVSALPVVQEFYRLVEQGESLGAIVESINFILVNALPAGRFVAGAFVCLDETARRGTSRRTRRRSHQDQEELQREPGHGEAAAAGVHGRRRDHRRRATALGLESGRGRAARAPLHIDPFAAGRERRCRGSDAHRRFRMGRGRAARDGVRWCA